ncbi:bifunctional nuclease family protein [Capnocytophaga canis]|uniref:bifunctional nuclease family protein n=1 Tax=Capnocytophaga canis TaxID=1848903 RepID=UPI001562025E|nr:bifunctional nuclease family protein [Capnocytophaga canis]
MDFVRLYIKRISYSHSQNEAFVLILHELESDLKLPIVIGAFEAQAIALELERNVVPPRPLTHDLFKIFAKKFNVNITKVVINRLENGIFYSNMVCERDGEEHIIDARTSDAIALALRFNAPIFTHHFILQKAGIYIPEPNEPQPQSPTLHIEDDEKIQEKRARFKRHSMSELKRMLEECIESEDYELAAELRDEITRRETDD